MSRKNTTRDPHAKIHMEIANAIRQAKKRMFANHRAGMSLDRAIREFTEDMNGLHSLKPADKETTIERLTEQALKGNTERTRHLALVQLFALLVAQESDTDTVNLVCGARDAAIKNATGLTEDIAAMLTNGPLPERSEFDDLPVLPFLTTARESDTERGPVYDRDADRLVMHEGDPRRP